jgi:CheY-like chemotaxis protein
MEWNSNKPLKGVRCLLATDKALTKELMVTALKQAGAGQTLAGPGPDMLRVVTEFKPEVIYAEYDMAPLDGSALIGHLRAEFKLTTPAILLFHEEDQKAALSRAREIGLNGALPIPFSNEAVIKMTRKVLGLK